MSTQLQTLSLKNNIILNLGTLLTVCVRGSVGSVFFQPVQPIKKNLFNRNFIKKICSPKQQ